MADMIARLKLESGEFDSKIKRATEGLLAMERECRSIGGTLEIVEKDQLEYIKALGQMQTSATSTRGKLAELTKGYTELHTVYQRMTDAEKASPTGQALVASLEQLKGRISETKQQLDSATDSMSDNEKSSKSLKDSLNDLAGKFGLNITQLGAVGVAYGVAKGAAEVFNRTMEATESSADAYATVQMQVNSVVNGFFRALSEGSFSSFLNGLSDITTRAREAYEALDELESYAARYNPKNAIDMQNIDKLMKEAAALQAKGDKEGALAKTQEARAVAEQAKSNTRTYGEKEYRAGISTLRNLVGSSGVNFTDKQLEWYSDPANWERAQKNAEKYKQIMAEITEIQNRPSAQSAYGPMLTDADRARIAELEASITPEMRRADAYMNTRDSGDNAQQFATATSQIYGRQRAEYAIDAIDARIMRREGMVERMTGGSSATTTTKEPKAVAIYDENALSKFQAQTEGKTETEKTQSLREQFKASIQTQFDADTTVAANEMHSKIQAEFEKLAPMELKVEANEEDVKAKVEAIADSANAAAAVIGSIGDAFNAIEDPAAKVAGTVAHAIATVAAGYAAATLQAAQGGPWAWIAFAATGLATMISTINAIHEQTGYEYGGIVKGNSYTGDNIPANGGTIGLNAGELILTRAQQGNLASQLTGTDGNLNLTTEISGENLRIILNRNNQRHGYSDVMTFKM